MSSSATAAADPAPETLQAQVKEHGETRRKKFGTFGGVFTQTLLTVLGVIMYLRLGWVMGNAGLVGGLLIIFLAFAITTFTALSMSSITTNIRICAGGAYAIVSQSLGLEIDGAVGIPRYISQVLAVTMYIFGFRAGWLLPLPWFSELHFGMQNAQGETMVSFLANDEVFEARPIGGRPFASSGTRGLGDFVYLGRWVNGFDLSDTWTAQVGVSGLYGPNATGSDANTAIYGLDAVLKWLPLRSDRGFPFFTIEGEIMGRRYEADDFRGCPEEPDCDDPIALDDDVLNDWGGYLQALWGFRRGWAVGLRGEYASGDGDSVGMFTSRSEDPFRDDRWRISPLLAWYPSEFSRVRLQYNYDRADFLEDDDAHTVWLGLEFLFGSHPAHRF